MASGYRHSSPLEGRELYAACLTATIISSEEWTAAIGIPLPSRGGVRGGVCNIPKLLFAATLGLTPGSNSRCERVPLVSIAPHAHSSTRSSSITYASASVSIVLTLLQKQQKSPIFASTYLPMSTANQQLVDVWRRGDARHGGMTQASRRHTFFPAFTPLLYNIS